jgi:hypothetical protein
VRAVEVQALRDQVARLGVWPRGQVGVRLGAHPGRAVIDDLVGVLVEQAAQRRQGGVKGASWYVPGEWRDKGRRPALLRLKGPAAADCDRGR